MAGASGIAAFCPAHRRHTVDERLEQFQQSAWLFASAIARNKQMEHFRNSKKTEMLQGDGRPEQLLVANACFNEGCSPRDGFAHSPRLRIERFCSGWNWSGLSMCSPQAKP